MVRPTSIGGAAVSRTLAALAILLFLTPLEASDPVFRCPMHRDVVGKVGDRCRLCGMALAAERDPSLAYSLEVTVPPAGLIPSTNVPVSIRVRDPRTGEVVRNFLEVHTKTLHLFVVSDSLEFYAHLHPAAGKDGGFRTTLNVPKAGLYRLLVDTFPADGNPQFLQHFLVTAGYRGPLSTLPRVTRDDLSSKTGGGVRTTLHMPAPVAGREQLLTFEIQDALSGAPIRTLQPYLGAWGHLLVVSADRGDAFHAHPVDEISTPGGPNVVFQLMFARPGIYKMWLQFQIDGEVRTVPFAATVAASTGAAQDN